MNGDATHAFGSLLEAQRAAPEHIRSHPQAHDVLLQLERTPLDGGGPLQDAASCAVTTR
jgi:hypothetical protein